METSLRPLPKRTLPPLNSNTGFNMSNEMEETSIDQSSSQMKRQRPQPRLPKLSGDGGGEGAPGDLISTDMNNSKDELNQTRRARTKRKQGRAARVKTANQNIDIIKNGHALTKMISEDDIIAVDHIDSPAGLSSLPGVAGAVGNSRPQDKVYVQTATGFRSRATDWVSNRQVGATDIDIANINSSDLVAKTSHVAINFHKAFMFISFLVHGLLAGLSVWQILFPFALRGSSTQNFIDQYGSLAQPIQTTIYFLTAICFISALDRYNLAKPNQHILWKLLKFQSTAWLTAAYLFAFMINVGMVGIDFWLGNIAQNVTDPTVASSYLSSDIDGSVGTWLALNVIRSCFCILGWFIIAARPDEDNTVGSLFESNEVIHQ